MRHTLSYRDRLRSSNAEVAFVRANFTAGRGHAWEGGRAPRSGIEAARVDYHFNVQAARFALRRRSGDGRLGVDNLSVFFLAEGEQPADEVMARLTTFIRAAKQTLDFAIYDMRFSDPLKASLSSALRERAEAGVKIRFCYDADKPSPPNVAAGQDPAPSGTGAFVQSLGYPWRRIAGMKLMHSKFILRDGQTVWTGSANMTDDAFTLMENNVVEIDSQALANYYAEDFEQLWEKQNFENTGEIHTQPVPVSFAGQPAQVRVMFSPGCGLEIDSEIARRVRAAQRRVRICSLLINSGTLINELGNLLRRGRVTVDGIYDRTQMEQVYVQWQEVPQNRWKIGALKEIIARTGLIGKSSTPYMAPGRHNYMHNKVLAIDNTVITGSYNFSRSAQFNAENILFIESAPLAEMYSSYIDHLKQKYKIVGEALH
jgi:phosphatidylserine/phosphatidylglycerophosphate/cardiolipin synthase-like enzyme